MINIDTSTCVCRWFHVDDIEYGLGGACRTSCGIGWDVSC